MGKTYRIVICGMKDVGKTLILEQVIYGSHKNNTVCITLLKSSIYIMNSILSNNLHYLLIDRVITFKNRPILYIHRSISIF